MKPKPIGIVGGAGPLAGCMLAERIFTLSNEKYNCSQDNDFPSLTLFSYPFSPMLSLDMDEQQLRKELKSCLNSLRNNGALVIAIACNTLHAFLDESDDRSDLVHLPRVVGEELIASSNPVVFCTTTSKIYGLHQRFYRCNYPNQAEQLQVDCLIDRLLKGENHQKIAEELSKLIAQQKAETVILGCTELSLLTGYLSNSSKRILDPVEIAANKIIAKSFNSYGESLCM